MAEIEAAINEEREARQGLGLREAFFGKGNFVRCVIRLFVVRTISLFRAVRCSGTLMRWL
jgi:hypothetical protein